MTTVSVYKDRIYADTLVTSKSKVLSERRNKILLLPRHKKFKSGVVVVGAIAAGDVGVFELYKSYLFETINLFASENQLLNFFDGLHKLNRLSSRRATFVIFGYNKKKEVVTFHPAEKSLMVDEFTIGSGSVALNRYLNNKTMDLVSDPLVEFGARVLLDDSSGTDFHLWDPKNPNSLQLMSLKDDKKVIDKIKKVLVNKMEVGL